MTPTLGRTRQHDGQLAQLATHQFAYQLLNQGGLAGTGVADDGDDVHGLLNGCSCFSIRMCGIPTSMNGTPEYT